MDVVLRTLFVHTAGTRLVLDGNSIKALREGAPTRRLPLQAIDTLVVLGGVDVSTPLLLQCAEQGRVIAFLSRFGKPRAVVDGALSGRSQLRRLQYAAHADPARRAEIAGCVVRGKIEQMAWALRQLGRSASPSAQAELRTAAVELAAATASIPGRSRDQLLGIEGDSSRLYFAAYGSVLRDSPWKGRHRRPVTDPINALLSWCYGMTRISVHGATAAAGLDPGTGYLHGDRASQPSLVLDLMEELRPSADIFAARLWNTRQIQAKHFVTGVTGAVEMTADGRDILFEAWHQLRSDSVTLKGRSLTVPNAMVPVIQAHSLANALRNGATYEAHLRVVR